MVSLFTVLLCFQVILAVGHLYLVLMMIPWLMTAALQGGQCGAVLLYSVLVVDVIAHITLMMMFGIQTASAILFLDIEPEREYVKNNGWFNNDQKLDVVVRVEAVVTLSWVFLS